MSKENETAWAIYSHGRFLPFTVRSFRRGCIQEFHRNYSNLNCLGSDLPKGVEVHKVRVTKIVEGEG